jgi:cation diffusion facilitator family transporter
MSHQSASAKSILFALTANLGIAITKTAAAIITGSGAMLAESIHSFADCGNQGLLFLGLRKSKKKPDQEHPLGYGKEIYFWSFIVAIILFSMGGMFSIYEGVHKIGNHEGLRNPVIAIIVLVISMVLEGSSLYGCLVQVKKVRLNMPLWKWVKQSRQSELLVVLGEDTAALFGLTFAIVSVLLSMVTRNPLFDAIGSIGIGVLLILVSAFIGIKVKGLLIGQSSESETHKDIMQFLQGRAEIEKIFNLITMQMGPGIMVAVKVKMKDVSSVDQLIANINTCEAELKRHLPSVQWIFFEPDITE